jgi:hypothetical protein
VMISSLGRRRSGGDEHEVIRRSPAHGLALLPVPRQ